MSQPESPPPARPPATGAERFPARRRLRWMQPDEATSTTEAEAAAESGVLHATRRLRDLLSANPVADPAPASSLEQERVSEQLGRLDQRLRLLLGRLASEGAGAGESPAGSHASGSWPDAAARELCARALAYFEEWRLLLLEERSPAQLLADFAASSYLDQLERNCPSAFLILDAEGVVLRAAHAAFAPGVRLAPEELEAALRLDLGGGALLVWPPTAT